MGTLPASSASFATKVAHNTFFNTLNTVLGLINAVVISIILARVLGPNLLGQYSYINYFIGLIVLVFSLGISGTITKILSEYSTKYDAERLRDFVRYLVRIIFIPVIVSAIVLWLLLLLINPHTIQGHSILFPIAAISVALLYLASVFRSIVSGYQDFRFLLRVSVYSSTLLLVGTILAALIHVEVAGYLIVALTPNIFSIVYVLGKYRWILHRPATTAQQLKHHVVDTFSYLWVVAIITILDTIVWQYSEVFFLGIFRSSSDVAYYSVAFSIASVALITLPGSFTGVLMPAISSLFGDAETERIQAAFHLCLRYMILFVVPLCFLLGALAEPIVSLLYGGKYIRSSGILPPLFAAATLGSISSVGATILYSTRKQKSLLKLMTFVAMVNIGSDLLFIPHFGLDGAVIANVTAQSIAAIGTLIIAFSYYNKKFNSRLYTRPLFMGLILAIVGYVVSRTIPGAVGLISALVVCGVLTLLLTRLLQLIDPNDKNLFLSIAEKFPLFLRRLYIFLLRIMITEL